MADTAENGREAREDDLWALIPWYVNGTLDAAESAAVQRAIAADDDFAAEVDRQLGVAARVCMLEEPQMEQAQARSWETLRARIEAEERARMPAPAQESAFARLLAKLTSRAGLAVAGGVCAAALAIAVLPIGVGEDDAYRTLTSQTAEAGAAIRFQAAPDVPRAALERLLAAQGLTLLGEPSEGGVFRAAGPEGADLDAAAQALMAAPEILFAAPEAQP
ncbi:hypothetical protein [Albimonas pacifica]|uniref:Zinc-finger n=1 Tax=Albimonas pacifica TaxID=1114924 RepID=A0A1I3BKU6_9RHOB|nr:hypothetical protein [Albimonas pacifica]SFH62944.1 hypothetical protein SAMN05216258_101167 [Albimonas pacifica]